MYFIIKRLIDIFLSISLLFIFIPVFVIAPLFILIFDRHNPFFIQERSGLNGKKIYIYKFKSMKRKEEELEITYIGKFLRISKLDELPQLFNVFIGNMSFIGPRPLYLEFNHYLKKAHKLRLSVKPGITGLAQIRVGDSTNWNKKFNYDIIYIKRSSIKLDIYIFFQTFYLIIKSLFFINHRPNEIIDYKTNFYESYKWKNLKIIIIFWELF